MKKRIWSTKKELKGTEFERFLISENTEETNFIATIPTHWDNAEENARLISAAPELLEALKKAERLITMTLTEVYRKEIQDYLSGGFADMVKEASLKDAIGMYKAIKKATE